MRNTYFYLEFFKTITNNGSNWIKGVKYKVTHETNKLYYHGNKKINKDLENKIYKKGEIIKLN